MPDRSCALLPERPIPRPLANLLKFLVLGVSTVAILHKLEPFGVEWF